MAAVGDRPTVGGGADLFACWHGERAREGFDIVTNLI
jgi:hypothetical protein